MLAGVKYVCVLVVVLCGAVYLSIYHKQRIVTVFKYLFLYFSVSPVPPVPFFERKSET